MTLEYSGGGYILIIYAYSNEDGNVGKNQNIVEINETTLKIKSKWFL